MRLLFLLSTIIISIITTLNLNMNCMRPSIIIQGQRDIPAKDTTKRSTGNNLQPTDQLTPSLKTFDSIASSAKKRRKKLTMYDSDIAEKLQIFRQSTNIDDSRRSPAKERIKRGTTRDIWNITDDDCLKYSSCAVSKSKTKWYCRCDEDCLEYDDCCHDYITSRYTDTTAERTYSTCSRLSKSTLGIYSISACPASVTNITLRKQCSVGDDHLATFLVVHNKTKVYKNMYCALCHNVTEFEYFYREITNLRQSTFSFLLSVSSERRQEFFMDLTKTADNLPPPGAKLRYCLLGLTTTNNSLCKSYLSPVVESTQNLGRIYKNMHCIENSLQKQCVQESTINSLDRNPEFLSKIMFSIYPEKLEQGCDIWSEEIFQTERCKGEPLLTNALTKMEMSWISNDEIPSSIMIQIGVLTAWLFASIDLVEITGVLLVKDGGNSQRVFVIFNAVYKKSAFIKQYQQFIDRLRFRNVTLFIASVGNFSKIELHLMDGNLNCSIAKCETVFVTNMKGVSVQEAMASVNVSINSLSVNIYSHNLVIRAKHVNDHLIINNILQDRTITPSSWSLPMVVTNACFAVSFAALLVLIIVQRKSNLVDNIPSSNIENISVSLALSNITFIVGSALSGLSKICYAIGVAQHYLWLAVFTFMTISVIWIGATLTKIRARKCVNSSATFKPRLALTILGLVVPTAFVCPALVIDVYGDMNWSPGYGSGACFPNRYPSNLVFFTGPIIMALTANLVILIYIICRVCAVRLGAANIRKLSPYQDALIYLRIAVISGVLWFTGIIASLFDAEWINYLFILLCGLHGFFLSLGTLTSKKVRIVSWRKEKTNETN